MDIKNFVISLGKLALANQTELSKEVAMVYWEDLQKLPYIAETIDRARSVKFFRGMPTVAELIELHTNVREEILRKKETESRQNILRLKNSSRDISDEDAKTKFAFLWDAVKYFELDPSKVYSFLDQNNVEIPKDYLENRGLKSIKKSFKGLEWKLSEIKADNSLFIEATVKAVWGES